jgi:hypothetical protein
MAEPANNPTTVVLHIVSPSNSGEKKYVKSESDFASVYTVNDSIDDEIAYNYRLIN